MPFKSLPFREVRRKLLAAGFVEVSQKGSHVKFGKKFPNGIRSAIVPHHREISAGTVRSILKQAGISEEVFNEI